jgi:hypothetical protein
MCPQDRRSVFITACITKLSAGEGDSTLVIELAGPITFESLSSTVANPQLSALWRFWRNLWEDSRHHAKACIDYFKLGPTSKFAGCWAGTPTRRLRQCAMISACHRF